MGDSKTFQIMPQRKVEYLDISNLVNIKAGKVLKCNHFLYYSTRTKKSFQTFLFVFCLFRINIYNKSNWFLIIFCMFSINIENKSNFFLIVV